MAQLEIILSITIYVLKAPLFVCLLIDLVVSM